MTAGDGDNCSDVATLTQCRGTGTHGDTLGPAPPHAGEASRLRFAVRARALSRSVEDALAVRGSLGPR